MLFFTLQGIKLHNSPIVQGKVVSITMLKSTKIPQKWSKMVQNGQNDHIITLLDIY